MMNSQEQKRDRTRRAFKWPLRFARPMAAGIAAVMLAAGPATARDGARYSYDGANRVKQVVRGATQVKYAYDALGNVVQRCEAGSCVDLMVDENTQHPRVVGEVPPSGGATFYAYGPAGLGAVKGPGGEVRRALTDAKGTVNGLVNASTNVPTRAAYDAYGRRRDAATGAGGSIGYAGEYTGGEGTVWLRGRSYAPESGRFLQRDDFFGFESDPQSLNRYSYVENNPVTNTDPSGHIPLIPILVGAALALAAHEAFAPEPTVLEPQERTVENCENLKDYNDYRGRVAAGEIAINLLTLGAGAIAIHAPEIAAIPVPRIGPRMSLPRLPEVGEPGYLDEPTTINHDSGNAAADKNSANVRVSGRPDGYVTHVAHGGTPGTARQGKVYANNQYMDAEDYAHGVADMTPSHATVVECLTCWSAHPTNTSAVSGEVPAQAVSNATGRPTIGYPTPVKQPASGPPMVMYKGGWTGEGWIMQRRVDHDLGDSRVFMPRK